MNILLDECLPRRLASRLTGHRVRTVQQAGWAGMKNGKLLELAATQFDAFVTADRNLTFQQPVHRLPIAVLVLGAPSTRLADLDPLVPGLLHALRELAPGELRRVPRS